MGRIRNAIHSCQHEVWLCLKIFDFAPLHDKRCIVAGICKFEFSGGKGENAHPAGNKKSAFISFAQKLIYMLKDFCRVKLVGSGVLKEGLCDYHEECRRHAFAAYVPYDKSKVVIINHIKIIKVAANFFCRFHRSIELHFLVIIIRRENPRQHFCLNLFCNIEFGTQAFLFCRCVGEVFYVAVHIKAHLFYRFCKLSDFVTAVNLF